MAITSGFFNSSNGDRKYTAEQISALFDGLINDGVFATIGTAFSVQVDTGMNIKIGVGRAWFNHTWVYNDAVYPMTVNSAEMLLDRIDAVVIEINHTQSVRAGTIKFVRGTPATNPKNPTLIKTDEVNQYPLAYIYIAAGVTSITQANITNKIGTSDCPYVTGIIDVVNIDNVVAQWESEFNLWFEDLQDVLGGETAANIANRLIELDAKFHTLAKEQAVYETIEDTSGNEILDSNNNPIEGRTVLGMTVNVEGGTIAPSNEEVDPFKVGDILSTIRTDLGEKWLLCNGQEVDRISYTALSNLLPVTIDALTWKSSSITNAWRAYNYVYTPFRYLNGKYCYLYRNTSDQYFIAHSDNPNGPWTRTSLPAYSGGSGAAIYMNLRYLNGYYIVTGYIGYNGNYAMRLLFSKNIDGPYTAYGDYKTGPMVSSEDICYLKGKYLTFGRQGNWTSGTSISISDNLSGAWTSGTASSTTFSSLGVIGYEATEDHLIICISGNANSTYIGYMSNPSSNFEKVCSVSPSASVDASSFGFGDGYYLIGFANGEIKFSTDPTNGDSWTSLNLGFSAKILCIAYLNGYFIISDVNGNIKYAKTPDGTWTSYTNATIGKCTSSFMFNDKYMVSCNFPDMSNDSSAGTLKIAYASVDKMKLPSLSSGSVYSYIKIME